MKGYKCFNKDMTCRGFQYEIGKTFKHEGNVEICGAGFHFCRKPADVFNYYSFDVDNIVCEVEASGKIEHGDDKSVCSEIKILKKLSWHEVLELVNTGKNNAGYRNSGDRNSGDRNSGYMNSGDRNSGDMNSGDMNSGDRNSGDWNSGDRNSGYMNSGDRNSGYMNSGDWNSCDYESGSFNSKISETLRIFNKECSREKWKNAEKPNFIYFDLIEWVADDTKTEQGYLKTYEYKEAWKRSWEKAKEKENWEEEYDKLINLPNFDKEVFFEITGIDVEKDK